MDAEAFEEADLYRAIAESGARVLLIGRRAVIAWGVPVITADYDLWIASEDAARINDALARLDMAPSRTPEQARAVGRYVIENGERVDVLVAQSVPTVDGIRVTFEDVWSRRERIEVARDVHIFVPSIEDLILTKRFAASAIAHVERLAQRELTPEEFHAWADGEIPEEEMREMRELIAWFLRRYPTPAERLRSARRRQLQLARTVAHVRSAR